MSEETIQAGPDDTAGAGDALDAFVAEEEPERKEPERAEPERREAKPDKEPAEKREAKDGDDKEKKDPEKPPEKRRLKVKTREAEEEVDEDEVVKGYLRGRDYTKKTQELAAQRKQIGEFLELLDKDPAAAFTKLGKGEAFTKAAERAVLSQWEQQFNADGTPLSEEQKEIRRLRAQVQTKEAAEREAADKAKADEERVAADQARAHWQRVVVKALDDKKLPKHLASRVGPHLADAIEHDRSIDPADFIDDAIQLAMEDVEAEHSTLFDAMEGEDILTRFPKMAEKVRKAFVARWKAKQGNPTPEPVERTERRPAQRKVRSQAEAVAEFIAGR